MQTRTCLFCLCAALIAWALVLAAPLSQAQEQDAQPLVIVLKVDGAIGPASGDFIVRGIADAEETNAHLIILQMNTPGGLDSSMRDIIRKILASEVPVATFVSPPGSRAASAGTYIAYASHIAAMAPATNLGSATPVNLSPGGFGDTQKPDQQPSAKEPDSETGTSDDQAALPGTAMERKVINDAVAYIKGLAKLRGRNEQWAEEAVRAAVNLTAEDALEINVIDLIANDVNDLLQQVDGRTIDLQVGEVTLNTADPEIRNIEPDWRSRFLAAITNPNVAYVLMFIGIYGLFFELSNPGAVFPGVIGGVCLLLAMYAFQVLPVNYAGLALIILGISFIVAELFITSFGVLGIGGAAAFVIGSLMLMDTELPAYQISLPLIVAVTLITALFAVTLVRLAIKQRKVPVSGGREEMIGAVGTALDDFVNDGNIHIHGETWAARVSTPVIKGQSVRVLSMDGLVLAVEPVEEKT